MVDPFGKRALREEKEKQETEKKREQQEQPREQLVPSPQAKPRPSPQPQPHLPPDHPPPRLQVPPGGDVRGEEEEEDVEPSYSLAGPSSDNDVSGDHEVRYKTRNLCWARPL